MDDYHKTGGDTFHLWTKDPTTINALGIVLAKIPIAPKFGKMLVASHKYEKVFAFMIMIVSCMSVQEIFSQSCGPS